jgi:spore coat polysaccharide biosynthesis predicted glycosyltransferase SpsG
LSQFRSLLVRCDVGPTYGVGHLMRCVALSEEFAARGFEVTFSADVATVPFARDQLSRRGFRWVDPPDTVAGLVEQAEGADAVVIDSYSLPREAYAAVRRARPTLAIVDGDPGEKDGHVIVDQNIGAEADDWPLPEGTVRLAGLDYALMRDEIRSARTARHAPPAVPRRVFAFFGGTDAFGAAPVLTAALVATGLPFDLRVVGATSDLRAQLSRTSPGPGQQVTILEPTSELAREVTAADLVVSAAGTSSWELLCLGAACAFVCVADNQEVSYGRVVALGAVAGLGRMEVLRGDSAVAVGQLARLLPDVEAQDRLRAVGSRLVDGRGRERVADAVVRHLQSE